MKRPYVICHILSSLDGKINGPFMGTEAAAGLSQEYGTLRSQMKGDAWLYGTTTTKEVTGFARSVLEEKLMLSRSLQSRHLLLIRLICGSREFPISLQGRKNWTADWLWKNCMSFSTLKKC